MAHFIFGILLLEAFARAESGSQLLTEDQVARNKIEKFETPKIFSSHVERDSLPSGYTAVRPSGSADFFKTPLIKSDSPQGKAKFAQRQLSKSNATKPENMLGKIISADVVNMKYGPDIRDLYNSCSSMAQPVTGVSELRAMSTSTDYKSEISIPTLNSNQERREAPVAEMDWPSLSTNQATHSENSSQDPLGYRYNMQPSTFEYVHGGDSDMAAESCRFTQRQKCTTTSTATCGCTHDACAQTSDSCDCTSSTTGGCTQGCPGTKSTKAGCSTATSSSASTSCTKSTKKTTTKCGQSSTLSCGCKSHSSTTTASSCGCGGRNSQDTIDNFKNPSNLENIDGNIPGKRTKRRRSISAPKTLSDLPLEKVQIISEQSVDTFEEPMGRDEPSSWVEDNFIISWAVFVLLACVAGTLLSSQNVRSGISGLVPAGQRKTRAEGSA